MGEKIQNKYYDAYTRDRMAVINFKSDIFELLTNIGESQKLNGFIKESEQDRSVRGLIFFSEPGCLGEKAYDEYARRIIRGEMDMDDVEGPDFVDKLTRFRQINILGRFIGTLSRYQKLFVTTIGYGIVTPFLGVVLAADFRLASPNGAFVLAHKKYGFHPSGSIPYLFPYYTGFGRGIELQLVNRIEALQAFKLGLFNQILPDDDFQDNCIRYVQPYLKNCPSTLRLTRRLNSFRFRHLEEYLEFEASLLNL